VFFSAILLILLASFFHSWYAGNAGASVSQVAFGFIWYGSYVLAFSIVLLISGLVLLLIAKGVSWAVVGAAAYFYVLTPLALLLLRAINLVPRRDKESS
jgi:hypothetical protein